MISLEPLRKFADNDEQLVADTLKLIYSELPMDLEQIQSALDDMDKERLKSLIHKTKVTFILIGSDSIHNLFDFAEKNIFNPNFEQLCIDNCKKALVESEKVLEELKLELNGI